MKVGPIRLARKRKFSPYVSTNTAIMVESIRWKILENLQDITNHLYAQRYQWHLVEPLTRE